MWVKLCHVCDGETPLGRAGSCGTAQGFGAAAPGDRLSGHVNASEGCSGRPSRLPIQIQQLTPPPNPHQRNSVPIQLMFLECLLCAKAGKWLEAAVSRCLVFKKTGGHAVPSLVHFPRRSVGLGLESLTPSQVGTSLPLISGRNPVCPLLPLSRWHTHSNSNQAGMLASLSLQETFQPRSRYKNRAFAVSLGINTCF